MKTVHSAIGTAPLQPCDRAAVGEDLHLNAPHPGKKIAGDKSRAQIEAAAGHALLVVIGSGINPLDLNIKVVIGITCGQGIKGQTAQTGAVLPRTELYLSRGTADQLYLAVRLAVCALCLPENPPILLDDALAAFDDGRMEQALALLAELAGERQILLFSCQRREGEAAAAIPGITRLTL